MPEVYVCDAHTPGRCDTGCECECFGHWCDYDEGHDGPHECACGARWADE